MPLKSEVLTKAAIVVNIISLFFLNGCAGKKATLNLSNITPDLIRFKVSRNFTRITSFEGNAKVIIELPGQGYKGSSKILINKPDSIFVKAEAILGIDIGALFLDDEYFAAFAPRDNILYYGETGILNLKDFLQIEIEKEELVETLTGLVQIPNEDNLKLEIDDEQFVLTKEFDKGKIKHWIDPQKYTVTQTKRLDQFGRVILLKEFSRFKKKKGVYLPQTIKITRPLARERLTLFYTNQKINGQIASSEFIVKVSKNAKKVYWGRVQTEQKLKSEGDK